MLRPLIRRLRRASAVAYPGLTDTHLLDRFVRDRDEAAFEVLVWRHGPTVLGVCRRTLGDGADADDAFQAVFLTLVRKAASVRSGETLAAWLCRIAYRISVRLRSERKRRGYSVLPELAAPAVPHCDGELKSALDAEIDRLPEAFRRAFVLCYLHGQTTAEAAQTLGCPRGTILSRLAAARKRLRRRLTHRGLAPAVVLAATAAVAWPSGELVASTIGVVKSFAAGGTVPRQIAALSQGVIRAMIWNKLKFVAVAVVAAGVLSIGFGRLTPGPVSVAEAQPPAKPAELPKRPPADPDAAKPDLNSGLKNAESNKREALELARQQRLKALHDFLQTGERELRDMDRRQIQLSTNFRCSLIELEEKARLMERIRAMQRQKEQEAKIADGYMITKEEEHTGQVIALRQKMAKMEAEHAVQDREFAEKREQMAAKIRAIVEQVREAELGPMKPERSELERRVAELEREVAELRKRK